MRSKIGVFSMVACAVFMLAIVVALGSLPTLAGEPATIAPSQPQAKELKAEVVYPCTVQLSPPFRSLPISTDKVAIGHEREINNPPMPKTLGTQIPLGSQTDPVVQESPGIDAMPGTVASFAGITNIAGVAPPDTEGDISPNHYLQWVNLHLAAWQINRSTNPYTATNVLGPIAGNTIWSSLGGPCATNNNGDPIVLWDRFRSRWVISQFALPSPYYTAIAVSQTADPTGSWWLYCFQYDATNMNDYPKFGVWPDGYYMSVNQFAGGATWAGAGLCVFEADKMITGDASARMLKINLGAVSTNFGGILPAHFEGMTNPPAGSPCYFLEADNSTMIPPTAALRLWKATVNWTTATFTVGLAGQPDLVIPTSDWNIMCSGTRDCIPQPGTTQHIDALGDRLMYRLQYRNYGSYESMVANHTVDAGSSRAGVRWYELRKDSGHTDWYLYQEGTYAPTDTYNRWMASAAQDHMGNLAIGYSVSDGTSMYPSLYYAGRLQSDPLGNLTQGEALMYQGTAAQTGVNRWGDYSSMSIDPTDDCAFWYTQEYSTGGWNWATRVGAFKYGSCALGPTGTLSGVVTSAATSSPISGATVLANNGSINVSTTTAADGSYTFTLPVTPPNYSVTASKYGYLPSTATGVTITTGATTTQNFSLSTAPSHVVSGVVSDFATAWPLYAQIAISGTGYPGSTIWTNPVTGYYSISLVDGITYSLTVTAWLPGYGGGSANVTPSGSNITQNFALVASPTTCNAPGYTQSLTTLFSENFDSATPPAVPTGWAVFDVSGTAGNWATATATVHPSAQPPHSVPNLVYFNSYTASSGYSTRLYRTSGLNLTGYTGLMLTFWMYHDTGYSGSADQVQVQVSTDAGTTWQNVGTAVNRYDSTTGWKQHTIPLTGFTGPLTDVRIGLLGISAYGNDCHVDDLAVLNATCTAPAAGGLIAGNVYDANTSGPATGALVSNSTTGGSATTVVTADPNVDDSFYCMYGNDGANSLTASMTGYGSDVHNPVVPHLGAVLQNFSLTAGHLQTSVSSMSAEMLPSQTTTQTLTITNVGGAPATYTLQELNMALRAAAKPANGVKASMMTMRKQASKIEKAEAETSIGRAPFAPKLSPSQPSGQAASPAPLNPGPPAYACDIYPGSNLVYFPDIGVPGTWTDLGSYGTYSFYAGDFLNGDFTKLYTIDSTGNNLYTLDTATHAATLIGPITPLTGESWTGLTASNDGTLYAASTNITRSTLYTVNPATGAATVVGQITNAPGIIDIAINTAGQMYGVDIVADNLISIDPATGAGAIVGALGINANYAQSLDFDDVSGTLYWAAYSTSGELRTINTTTGASTLIGAFPGGAEVDCLAIKTFVSPDVPWLSEAPTTGTLGPGEHVDIAVTYDSTGLSAGAYHAQLKIANNTPYAVANVPVTLNVLPSLAVTTAANVITGPAPLLVTFTSTVSNGTGPYTYDWNFGDGTPHSNAANPSHRFTAPGMYPVSVDIHDSGDPSHTPPLPVQNALDTHLSVNVTSGLVDRIPYSVVPTKLTTTNNGTDGTVTWDATNCPSANYHIIYGMGSGLSAWAISGGKCAIGYSGTYAWSSVPNPSADSKRFLWFLVVGDDGGVTEGSWGKTSAGTERGGSTASGQCGCTAKVTTTTCGTSPSMPQR